MERPIRAAIPVALITDDNFVMQTAVAIRSLLDSRHADTRYDIRVVMASCAESSREKLAAFPEVTIVEASTEAYSDIRQMAHIPIACLLKFDLCELLPDCDRILYIDGDVIVRDDLTALYEWDLKGHILAAAPQTVLVGTEDKKISAGILLFDAKRMRDEHARDRLVETRRSLGDQRSMDQQSFNLLLGEDMAYLPLRYNCCPVQVWDAAAQSGLEALNAHYGTDYESVDAAIADAAIVHFATGSKPWLYDNIEYGDLWFQTYKNTPYGAEPLARAHYSVWDSRIYGLKRAYKEGGIFGAIRFLWRFVQKKVFKKTVRNDWG